MKNSVLTASAAIMAALIVLPAAESANAAGSLPLVAPTQAKAPAAFEHVQWRGGGGWHGGWHGGAGWYGGPGWRGGWRPGWRWGPGWGWGPRPFLPYYTAYPYYYGSGPYYGPGPYYGARPCCDGPRPYAPEPPLK
jgi:hypothetical protein